MQNAASDKIKHVTLPEWLITAIIIVCLTYISIYGIHLQLVDVHVFAAGETDRMHHEMLAGQAESPVQYRPGSYWLVEWTKSLFKDDLFQAYIAHRFIFTILIGLLLMHLFRQHLTLGWAFAGLAYFYALIPWAYLGYHHQPADPINLSLFLLGYITIMSRKPWWIILIVGVGMVNRETVMLLPVFDLILNYDKRPVGGHILRVVLSIAAGLIVYAAIYLHFGPREHPDVFVMVMKNLSDPVLIKSFGVFLLPPLAISLAGWKSLDVPYKRWLSFSLIFIGFYFVFGYLREMRLLTPIMPLILITAFTSLKRWFESN